METTRSPGAGSGNSGTCSPEAAVTLRFEEEIQSLIHPSLDSPPLAGGSSFTALLGLPLSQAVELLHESEREDHQPSVGAAEMWRQKALCVPLGFSPTFPSNAALVERAARFSVYAAEDASAPPAKPKVEPSDSGEGGPQRPGKRKDGERGKAKGGKKSRTAAEEYTGGEKLPCVHVRPRRGQATDSHSLAERARREKINARMKLLQELVPGCSKITGTALVLDEIISHVQSLQRQVEMLSMRLAAVHPRMDFSGLNSFLSAECGRMGMDRPVWSDGRWQQQQQQQEIWHLDMVQQQYFWKRGEVATPHEFIGSQPSLIVGGGHDETSGSLSLPN